MESVGWKTVEVKHNKRKIRLGELAIRLNVNSESIVQILKHAGFVISYNSKGVYLNEKELQVLSIAYSKGVKLFFNKSKNTRSTTTRRDIEALYNFFSRFLHDKDLYSPDNILDAKLDETLIEQFFYSIVSTNFNNGEKKAYRNFSRILFRIIQKFDEVRKKAIATFINYHYYNFTKDEDSERSNILIRFS